MVNAILDVDGSEVDVAGDVERHADIARSIVAAGRSHVLHAFHAVDLLLDWSGYRRFNRLGVRAVIKALTTTCGGARSGNCATGSVGIVTAPAKIIRSAQTVAKIGR